MNRPHTHTSPVPGNHVGIISPVGGYEEECHLLSGKYSIPSAALHPGPAEPLPCAPKGRALGAKAARCLNTAGVKGDARPKAATRPPWLHNPLLPRGEEPPTRTPAW